MHIHKTLLYSASDISTDIGVERDIVIGLLFKTAQLLLKGIAEDDLEEGIELAEDLDSTIPFRSISEFSAEHVFDPLTFILAECHEDHAWEFITVDDNGTHYTAVATYTGNPMGQVYKDNEPLFSISDGQVQGELSQSERAPLALHLQALMQSDD